MWLHAVETVIGKSVEEAPDNSIIGKAAKYVSVSSDSRGNADLNPLHPKFFQLIEQSREHFSLLVFLQKLLHY